MTAGPVGILGTGAYVPAECVTNADVAVRAGVDEDWIRSRTGILERRFAAPDEATSDLATRAAGSALVQAGVEPNRLDYLILATSTPDSPQPPTSHLVQHRLRASRAACLDVNAACTGFVWGLVLASSLCAQNPGRHALVVAAEVCSRAVDFSDRRTAVLMGDGAGAAVVGPVDSPYGVGAAELASRGESAHLIRVEAGGSRLPSTADSIAAGAHLLKMDGRGVVEFLLRELPPFVAGFLRRAGVEAGQLDHLVSHQPNGVLLARLVERMGLGHVRLHRTLERCGNTAAACGALALDQARSSGALTDGDLVLIVGFGSGMSMGAVLLRWGVRA